MDKEPFGDSPSPEQPSDRQLKELRAKFDLILNAFELAQDLEHKVEPVESEDTFYIDGSLSLDALRIPTVLRDLTDKPLAQVIITFRDFSAIDKQPKLTQFCIDLIHEHPRLNPDTEPVTDDIHIAKDRLSDDDRFEVKFAKEDGDFETVCYLGTQTLSNLVASIVHPTNTPELTNYSDLEDPDIATEIKDTLRERLCDSLVSKKLYPSHSEQLPGAIEIIYTDGELSSLELTRPDDDRVESVMQDPPRTVVTMDLNGSSEGIAFHRTGGELKTSEPMKPTYRDLRVLQLFINHAAPGSKEPLLLGDITTDEMDELSGQDGFDTPDAG